MSDNRQLAEQVARLLTERGETLAVAEASAGGHLSAELTAVPGSSRWFVGGAIVYAAAAKERLLGIAPSDLAGGVVESAAALLLARSVRERLGTTWGLAETGVAGPQAGRRSRKPAGLAYVAASGSGRELARRVQTGRDEREPNQEAFAGAALALLVDLLG